MVLNVLLAGPLMLIRLLNFCFSRYWLSSDALWFLSVTSHLFSCVGGESREQLQGMLFAALFSVWVWFGGHSTDWGALVTGLLGLNSPFYPWPSPASTLFCFSLQSVYTYCSFLETDTPFLLWGHGRFGASTYSCRGILSVHPAGCLQFLPALVPIAPGTDCCSYLWAVPLCAPLLCLGAAFYLWGFLIVAVTWSVLVTVF